MKNKEFPVQVVTRTALLFALTLVVQSLGLPNAITGPLVNFMLVISTLLVGTTGGILIGSFTPWVALAFGILPTLLAPAIPFIMLGNTLLCLMTGLSTQRSQYWKSGAILLGGVLKFLVIASATSIVLTLPAPVTQALMLPQLINAIIGGILAVSVSQSVLRATQVGRCSQN